MPSPDQVRLSELISEKPRNGLYKAKEFQGKGHRWIKMNEVYGNDFFLEQFTELLEVTESEVSRFNCQAGDLLFGRTSLTLEGIGDCLLVGEVDDVPIFESNLFRIRFNLDKAYPLFYYYFFKSKVGKLLIQTIAKQTAATSITSTDLITLPVPYYPVDIQKEIANQIHLLDKKIELNRQTNQTLEHIAQAIFKSWFVDFEPSRAKIAAKQIGQARHDSERSAALREALLADDRWPEAVATAIAEGDPERAAMAAISGNSLDEVNQLSQEQQEQLKSTAALFPDVLVDSELGEMPEGWKVKTIEDISTNVAMGPFGSNIKVETFVDEGIPIINGQQLKGLMLEDGENKFITYEHADKLIKSNVYRDDIVITHRGTLGQVSIIPKGSQYDRYIVSQSQCYIRPNKEVISPLFLIFYFKSYIGQHELLAHKSQVGVPSIAKPVTNLRKIELVVPSKGISDRFQLLANSLQIKISNGLDEMLSLENIRNALLPKLLSGELNVDSEEVANAC